VQHVELGVMVLGVDVYDLTVDVLGFVQDGATPIHAAAQNGRKECIEVLAGLGGDVNKAMIVSLEGAALPAVVACAAQLVELDVMVYDD